MYKYSIKNMPQKVCIRKKWPIFIVYLKWARILKKKYQRVQKTLNWFKRVHTDLKLCKCRFKFSWTSVPCKNLWIRVFRQHPVTLISWNCVISLCQHWIQPVNTCDKINVFMQHTSINICVLTTYLPTIKIVYYTYTTIQML